MLPPRHDASFLQSFKEACKKFARLHFSGTGQEPDF